MSTIQPSSTDLQPFPYNSAPSHHWDLYSTHNFLPHLIFPYHLSSDHSWPDSSSSFTFQSKCPCLRKA